MRHARRAVLATLTCFAFSVSAFADSAKQHFHPKGKPPSQHTIEKQQELRAALPFADEQDFEEQKKSFIAAPAYKQIMAEAGHVAWDTAKYDFLLQGEDYDSIHPSLQRHAVLNTNYGLYEVIPGIYQVRGYDLANISFIKGDTGWIVFDPLTAKETAGAALDLINEQLGERPMVAVVYSHSHADHFGGVRGVVEEADVRSGKVKVIAPVGFMDHAVAENIYAGNAMSRRLFYQYGVLLPANPYGHVDQKIGKNTAAGNLGLIAPDNGEKFVVEISNATLINIEGHEATDADLTITIDRSDLETVMMGAASFDQQIEAGKAKLVGDDQVFATLQSTLVKFELGFELMPGTGEAGTLTKAEDSLAQDLPYLSGE